MNLRSERNQLSNWLLRSMPACQVGTLDYVKIMHLSANPTHGPSLSSYVAIISAATLCRRKDVVVPCWAAFQREFMWSRAYFLVWWILKVLLQDLLCST